MHVLDIYPPKCTYMFIVILFIITKTRNDQMSINSEKINCDVFTQWNRIQQ